MPGGLRHHNSRPKLVSSVLWIDIFDPMARLGTTGFHAWNFPISTSNPLSPKNGLRIISPYMQSRSMPRSAPRRGERCAKAFRPTRLPWQTPRTCCWAGGRFSKRRNAAPADRPAPALGAVESLIVVRDVKAADREHCADRQAGHRHVRCRSTTATNVTAAHCRFPPSRYEVRLLAPR